MPDPFTWVVERGIHPTDDWPTRRAKRTLMGSLVLPVLGNAVSAVLTLAGRHQMHPNQFWAYMPTLSLVLLLGSLAVLLYARSGDTRLARLLALLYGPLALVLNWALGQQLSGLNYISIPALMVALLVQYPPRLVAAYACLLALWVTGVNLAGFYGVRLDLEGADQRLPPLLGSWLVLVTSSVPLLTSCRSIIAFHGQLCEQQVELERGVAMAQRYAAAIAVLQLDEADGPLPAARHHGQHSELAESMQVIMCLLRTFLPYIPESVLVSARAAGGRAAPGRSRPSTTTTTKNPPGSAAVTDRGSTYFAEGAGSPSSSRDGDAPAGGPQPLLDVGMRLRSVTLCAVRLAHFFGEHIDAVAQQDVHNRLVSALEWVSRSTGGVAHFLQGDSALLSFNAVTCLDDHKLVAEVPHTVHCTLTTGRFLVGNVGTSSSRHFDFFTPLVGRLHGYFDLPPFKAAIPSPALLTAADDTAGVPGGTCDGSTAVVDQHLFEHVQHSFFFEPFEAVAQANDPLTPAAAARPQMLFRLLAQRRLARTNGSTRSTPAPTRRSRPPSFSRSAGRV